MFKERIAGKRSLEGFAPAALLYEEVTYRSLVLDGLEKADSNSIFVMGMTVALRRAANRISNNGHLN